MLRRFRAKRRLWEIARTPDQSEASCSRAARSGLNAASQLLLSQLSPIPANSRPPSLFDSFPLVVPRLPLLALRQAIRYATLTTTLSADQCPLNPVHDRQETDKRRDRSKLPKYPSLHRIAERPPGRSLIHVRGTGRQAVSRPACGQLLRSRSFRPLRPSVRNWSYWRTGIPIV